MSMYIPLYTSSSFIWEMFKTVYLCAFVCIHIYMHTHILFERYHMTWIDQCVFPCIMYCICMSLYPPSPCTYQRCRGWARAQAGVSQEAPWLDRPQQLPPTRPDPTRPRGTWRKERASERLHPEPFWHTLACRELAINVPMCERQHICAPFKDREWDLFKRGTVYYILHVLSVCTYICILYYTGGS